MEIIHYASIFNLSSNKHVKQKFQKPFNPVVHMFGTSPR